MEIDGGIEKKYTHTHFAYEFAKCSKVSHAQARALTINFKFSAHFAYFEPIYI